ncbi:MAG: hypothetical protein JNK05_27310 [Myxococcales bacterium]|nr:hypothetical protein [Myxococcales bacterium]
MAANETVAGWLDEPRAVQPPAADRAQDQRVQLPASARRWLDRRLKDTTAEATLVLWSDEGTAWVRIEQGGCSSTMGFACARSVTVAEWTAVVARISRDWRMSVKEGARGELRVAPLPRG